MIRCVSEKQEDSWGKDVDTSHFKSLSDLRGSWSISRLWSIRGFKHMFDEQVFPVCSCTRLILERQPAPSALQLDECSLHSSICSVRKPAGRLGSSLILTLTPCFHVSFTASPLSTLMISAVTTLVLVVIVSYLDQCSSFSLVSTLPAPLDSRTGKKWCSRGLRASSLCCFPSF